MYASLQVPPYALLDRVAAASCHRAQTSDPESIQRIHSVAGVRGQAAAVGYSDGQRQSEELLHAYSTVYDLGYVGSPYCTFTFPGRPVLMSSVPVE